MLVVDTSGDRRDVIEAAGASHRDRVAGGSIDLHRQRCSSRVDGARRPTPGHGIGRIRGPKRDSYQDGDETRRYHIPGHAQVQARRAVHVGRHRVRPVHEHHRAADIALSVRGRSPAASDVQQQQQQKQQLDHGQRRGRVRGRQRTAVGLGRGQGELAARQHGCRPAADGVRVRHGHRRSEYVVIIILLLYLGLHVIILFYLYAFTRETG